MSNETKYVPIKIGGNPAPETAKSKAARQRMAVAKPEWNDGPKDNVSKTEIAIGVGIFVVSMAIVVLFAANNSKTPEEQRAHNQYIMDKVAQEEFLTRRARRGW